MNKFISIYNFNGITILYTSIVNIHDFTYKLNCYINTNNISCNTVYIITNFYKESINFDFLKDTNIILLKSNIHFEMFFNLHELRHDYFYKNKITETDKILNIFNKISVPFDKYPNINMYSRRNWFTANLNTDLNKSKEIMDIIKQLDTENKIYNELIQNKPITDIDEYKKLLEEINNFLIENINCFQNETVNFKEYSNSYKFEQCNLINGNCIAKNIILENVYYINKCWFDKDKNPFIIEDFNNDFEYKDYRHHFEANITDITDMPIFQEINEEVMYLDYVYGFYNFGEFWDIVKRLLVSNEKNLPLFHLSDNRITNIGYYFDKLPFKFPTQYQKQERNNKLYYFNKLHITTVSNAGCRGLIDNNLAYQFNKVLNPCQIIEKSYNIYLARSNYGRSIQDENKIVDILKQKYNFIVLDGKEKLEDTIHYFTNAKIILGAHGSLMKNMIWSKKNPVLIELCPPTRHDCFYGNAQKLQFLAFFILTDCNEKEELILNDEQIEALYNLLDNLV